MNEIDTIENAREVGGNYFQLYKTKRSDKYLIDFINLFNFDDYWCYKGSNRQKLVTQEEFLEFKNSTYMFLKKDLYDTNNINEWIDFIYNVGGHPKGIQFLTKPTPPFSPNKVIIRENRGI